MTDADRLELWRLFVALGNAAQDTLPQGDGYGIVDPDTFLEPMERLANHAKSLGHEGCLEIDALCCAAQLLIGESFRSLGRDQVTEMMVAEMREAGGL